MVGVAVGPNSAMLWGGGGGGGGGAVRPVGVDEGPKRNLQRWNIMINLNSYIPDYRISLPCQTFPTKDTFPVDQTYLAAAPTRNIFTSQNHERFLRY